MTYTIGMVSQKGGVGKSTLARMMAREFVAGGLTTKIADLDTQQQTCAHWAGRRAENGVTPEMQVQSFASVKTALEDAPRFDALILDGKPNASEQTLCSHRKIPPFGAGGGQPGQVGVNRAVTPDGTIVPLAGNDEIDLPAGGVFEMFTPGGGGWGAPE